MPKQYICAARISSRAGGHEENGLLFELENPQDLSRQLRRLGEEPGLLRELCAGIRPVKTVGEYADELEELYASLVPGQ